MSSCLVSLQDYKGRLLQVDNVHDLHFGSKSSAFRLARLGGNAGRSVGLQHESGQWLTLEVRQLTLGPQPVPLEFYINLDKLVAFKLPTGDFLASKVECGTLIAATGPLRKDRATKLFSVKEVALPRHAMDPWPLCCSLATADGVYMSNSGGKAAANVEVPCCSEELIIDVPAHITASGVGPAVFKSSLWNGTATHLASVEPLSASILFRPQHACTGHEDFEIKISPFNKLTLERNTPVEKGQTAAAGVTCQWPSASCVEGAKPTLLHLELISTRENLIISAFGTLLGLQEQPRGRLADALWCFHHADLSSVDLRPASWTLEHHGDCVYSIRSAATGRHLYLGDHGVLMMEGSQSVEYPDPRTLFTVEYVWTEEVPQGAQGVGEEANESTQGDEDDFVPLTRNHCASGFVIKTMVKFDGQQMCLCALPDGRITAVFASSPRQLSRWELFTIADKKAAMNSPLKPLERLPEGFVEQPVGSMRRSSSCQAIISSKGQQLHPSNSGTMLSTSPSSLPGILETEESVVAVSSTLLELSPLELFSSFAEQPSLQGARRCMSDSALTELVHRQPLQRKALATHRQPPSTTAGWGVKSATTIQDTSLQTLCLAVYQECLEMVPSPRAADFIRLAEERLQSTLPDEIFGTFLSEIDVLVRTPEPTKLGYRQLHKAVVHGTAPSWAESMVVVSLSDELSDDAFPEELAESCLCQTCKGSTGLLLPLDPEVNPRHHRFLAAMERRHFGGARRRRGAQRMPDALSAGLYLAKHGILMFGIAKCLGALLKGGGK